MATQLTFAEAARARRLGGEQTLTSADLREFSEAEEKILAVLADGRFHTGAELIRASGQQEGLRRLRDRYDPHERSRNRLVILLQLAMGLRVAEVQKLNFGDLENGALRVSGKGRHFRHLPIPAAVAGELNWYLQCREVELKRRYRLWVSVPEDRRKRYPLLVTRHVTGGFAPNDFRVSIKGLYEVVRQAGERAGLKDVHPHLLRHTFAHDLLDKTHNIALVAKALGHKSLRHTQRYVDPTDKDMREAMA